jgi:hypothetical protein
MKKTKIIMQILDYIAAITLYSILISLAQHLINMKIIVFKWDWLLYFYWFGVGIF